MKKCALTILAFLTLGISSKAGWFSNDAEQKEKERREQAEQHLAQEQHTNGNLEVVILVLSVGCVAALVLGTAVGSKTWRSHEQK